MKRKAAKQWIRYRLARGKKWQRMIGWRSSIQLTFSAPVLALSVGVAGTLLTPQAQGATYDWTGVAGTAWDTTGDAWTAGPGTTPWDATNGLANIANFTTSASPALSGNVFTNGVVLQSGVSVALGGAGTLNFVGASPTLTLGNSVNTNLWFTSSNVLAGSPVVTTAGTPSGTFARVMLEGTTQTVGGLSDASGTLVIQNAEAAFDGGLANTGTGTLIINGSGNYSTNGLVRDQTGKLAVVMNGTGTQIFSGGGISYTGATTIDSGTLVLDNTSNFNSAVTVNAGGVLTTTGASNVATGASSSLTLNGGTYNQNATAWRVWGAPNGLTVTGAGGTINNTAGALLFDGGLAGSGNLVINNTGAVSVGFRGTNFSGYSGDLTVNGGQIGASVNGLFANSNVTLNGATFNTNGVPFTGASAQNFKSINGNGTLTGVGQIVTLGTNNGSGSFSGTIAGSVAIIKAGTGTQTLSGTNTTTGATTVSGGVLNLDYTTNNTSKLANGGVLTLGGGTLQLTGGSHTEIVASTTLNAGSSQVVRASGGSVLQMGAITRNTGATIDFSADNIATTTSALDASGILGSWATVGGTRYATKSGNNIVAYTGTTAASVNNFVSATGNYEYSLSGGTDTLTANRIANTVRYSGTGETIDLGAAGANTLTFGSIMNAGTGTLVIQRTGGTGSVILSAGGDNIITRAGGDITISAPISSGSLSKTGAGTLTLSGNNTYAGTTSINGGTLKAGSATALGAATNALIVNLGATLDVNGNNLSVGSLADNSGGIAGGGGTITNGNAAAGVLTVGSANTSTTFGGVLQNGVGTLGLTKTGTGTLTLVSDNALGGLVTINGGTLALGAGGTTGSLGGGSNLFGAGGVTVTSPGTLAVNRSGAATVASSISGTGAVTYTGGGTFTYSGTASNAGHTGTTTVTQGNLVLSKTGGAVAIGGDLIINSTTAGSARVWATQNNQTSGTGILNLASAANHGYFMLEGTTQTFAGITNAAANVGVIENAESPYDGGLANAGIGTLNLNVTGGPYTYSAVLQDGTSGKLALNKTGAGTQTLSGGNIKYTGATTVGGGVLNLVNTFGMASATTVNTGGILRTSNTASGGYGAGFALTLNGGTFEHNQNFFSTFAGPLTVASASTIKTFNTTGTTQAYFDGGASGSGNLLVDNTGAGAGAGAGIVFRNTGASTSLTGTVTVNGGLIGYGNGSTALRDAQLTLQGAKLVMDGSNGVAINTNSSGTVGALVGNASSSVLLGAGGTLTMGGRNQSDLFAGIISGGGGITKIGTGTQTLSGNNTYSGATTVNNGALLLTGANTLAGGLVVNNGGALTVSGTSTLNGATTVNRGGTLTLSGAIGGTGATTVSGGTLNLDYSTQDNSKLANGVALTLGGATVNLSGGTHTEVVGSTTFAVGDTQINRTSGSAQLNLGAITMQTGATVDFSTAGFAITSTSNDVSGILGANITVNNGQDYAVNNGDVGGGVGHIVAATSISVGRLGPGNVILSNSTANYKIIEAGTTGNITLGGVGVTQANTINNASTGGMAVINTTGNSLVLGVSGGILGGTSSAGLTIGTAVDAGTLSAGGTTANAAGSITVTNNSAVGMVINSTIINHGSGVVSLTKTGTGTLTLNGTNTYTGATGINAGILIAGNNSALGVNSNVSVASGAILDVNGKALVLGGLNNVNNQGGTVTNNGAAATLSVGGVNSAGTFSGVIQDGSGTLALTKIGTGTQTLLGTNTYSGLTTINAGALQIGNGSNTGTLGSGDVVNNASLIFNRNDVYTVANGISGTGTTSVINGGTVTFSGAIASTQALTALGTVSSPGSTIILNRVGGNTVGNVTVGVQSGTGNYAQGGILLLGASDQIADTSVVTLRSQANNNRAGQFQLLGFNDTIGGLTSSGNGAGIVVQNGAATDSTLTITSNGTFGAGGGTIRDGGTGKLNIVKSGAGTQAFQGGSYTYTGTTTVTGGTLSIRSASFNTSATTVAGGTLDFQGATVNTSIAGTTGLVTITGGTTTFGGGTGSKTYSVQTQISGGATLSQSIANSFSALSRHDVAAGSTLTTNGYNGAIGSLTGAGQVSLAGAGAVLSIGGDNTTDAIFSGQIGGASISDQTGGIRKYGTGTQTLTGNNNNYVGITTVADGILRIGNGGTSGVLGSGAVVLLNPGTLELKRSDTQTVANQISGDGNLSHTGSGTTTLTGANTYSGTTTVTTGTLKAGVATLGGASPSSGAFGVNSAMTVAGGATLDLNGFDESIGSLSGAGTVTSSNAASRTLTVGTGGLSGAFSGIISNGVGGTTSLLKTGAGTQTLTGANTYTGSTTVGGGTLALDFSGAASPLNNIISPTSSLTMSGGTLVITGKSGATNTQTFAGTTVTGGSTIQLVQNGATSLDVSLGALNFSGGGLTFLGGTGTTSGARFITTSSAGANDGTTRLGGGSLWSNGNFASIMTVAGVNYVVEWNGVITNIYTGPAGPSGLAGTVIPNAGAASVSIITGGGAGTNTLQAATSTVDSLSMKATDAPSLINMAANSANDTLVVGSGASATGDLLISNGVGVKGMTVGLTANQGFLTAGSSGASNLNISNNSASELLTINSAVVNNAGGGPVTVNISGGGSNGKVVFAGTNTYTGNTSIGGGTLQVAGAGSLGAGNYAGAIAITGGTLQYSSSANQTLSGLISGTGGLVKDTDANSTLTLTANNTYGGGTVINAGHLQVGNGGGTGTLGGGSVTNNADLIFNRDNSSVYTVNNLITGTGTVTKKGNGTVVYTADNSYSGLTTVENGTLQLGEGGTTGSFGSGNVALTSATSILAINHSNAVTLGNVISGLGGLTQMGIGTTTLNGNNSYTGVTTISGGVLQVSTLANGGVSSSIGAASAAASNLVLSGGGTLAYVGTATALTDRGFTLAGNATVSNLSSADLLTMSGGGVHTAATNDTLTLHSVSGAISTLSGALTQPAGTLNVNKTGSGIWALTSAASNYTGTTTITEGTLQVRVLANGGANSSIGASSNAASNLVLNAGTTLSYTGVTAATDHNFTLNGSATLAQDGAANSTLTWNGAPVVTSTGTTTLTLGGGIDVQARTGIMAGVLSNGAGTLELTKSGTSTWVLTNANTYSGVTRVNGGTLQIGNGSNTGTLGTNTSVVLGGGNLAFNRNDAITIAKVISGSGTVSQIGSGTTTLTGNGTGNTYTGATIVSNGVLKAGIATNAFGNNSAVTVGTGVTTATLDLAGFSQNIGALNGNTTGVVTSSVAGPATLTTTGGSGANVAGYTYAGVIQDGSGTVGLTKTGAGTEILTGTNTYSGLTTVSGGTLMIGNGTTTGTLGSGNVVNNANLAFNRSNSLNVANTISGTGVVQQIGSGTTVLSSTNTYTGKTQILNGALSVTTINSVATNATLGTVHLANSDLGAPTTVANGTIDLGSGTTTGTLIYTGTGETTDRVINLNGTTGGGTIDQSGTGLLRFTSDFTATGVGAKTLTLKGSTAGTGEIDGNIADSTGGATSLVKDGTGTWTLLSNNSYTGSTTINAGTLQLGNGGTQGSIGSSNIINNGTLAFNRSDTITYSGSVSGTGNVVQRGSGTTILTGISTYTGKTVIEDGTISVDTIQDMGALTGSSLGRPNVGDVTNSYIDLGTATTTGTFKYTGDGDSTNRGFNLVGNGTLDQSGTGTLAIVDNGIQPAIASTTAGAHTLTLTGSSVGDGLISGTIADGVGTVGLTKTGTGTWTLSGANTYSGDTNVNAGVLNIQNSNALGTTAGDTTVASGAALQLQNNIAVGVGEALTLNGTGVSNDGALRNISGDNSWAGPITLGSPVRINSDAGLLTLSGGIGGAGQNLTVGGAGNTTVSGVIATTTGTLTKDGAGTLTLTNANTYTGATAVNAGTLAVTGSIASTVVDIATGATLSVSNGAAINDLAAVTSAGTGAFVLNNSETIGSLAGTGTVNLGANTLTTGGNNTSTTYAGVIGGTDGDLVKTGTGTFTLTGTNTYTGDTTVADGMLKIGGGGSLGSGTYGGLISLASTGTLEYNSTADQILSGAISGTGALTQSGPGKLTLSGNSAGYTGATTVNGGTLDVAGSIASSPVTVNNGGILTGDGAVGATTINAGGTLANNAGSSLAMGATSLSSTANTSVGLGSASNPALFNVTGNLTLDGNLNVTDAGGFTTSGSAPVVYHIYTYTGALTNNGLAINSLPAGADPTRLIVQTSINGQVNLVDTNGFALSYWDGDNTGLYNNNQVNGGNGTWFGASGPNSSQNWTDANGIATSIKAPNSFAFFAGTAGTVTVNDTSPAGVPDAAGLYFMTTGYTLNGGSIVLANGGNGSPLHADPGVTATINSKLIGTENINKTGTGTIILGGVNTYSGSTTVSAGTLSVTGSIASTVVNISDAATLSVANGAALVDTAAVTSAGTGAFTLNNSETIGSLAGTGTVDLGANTLTTGGTNASTTYAGAIGGTGGLTKAGTGNFTLTGVNTYTGATSITGTLTLGGSGSLGGGAYAGAITNNGSLVHSSSANQVLSGVLSGAGSLIQNGAGTLTLSGNSAGSFTGATTVNGGTLIVDGSITNSVVTVNSGGTLTGIGTVGATTINTGGTLDAGSIGNPGILNVAGNLGIAGTYRVDISGITAGTGYDQTKVIGTVTLGGGSTLVLNDPTFTVPGGNTLTIIDNDGAEAVSGIFSGLTAGTSIAAGASNFKIYYDGGDGNDVVLVSTSLPSPLYINNEWTTAATVDGDQELAGSQTAYVGINAFDSLTNALATYSTASNGAAYAGDIFVNGGTYSNVNLAGGDAVTLKLVSDGGNAQPDVTIQSLSGDANDAIVTRFHGAPGNADLTVEQGSFAGVISGGGDLTKTTAGTLTLSGTNTYTGATNVNGGTLNVTGSIASSSLLTVNTGGTLTGTGTVGATNVASGGTLANTVGSTLTLGTTTLDPNATTSVGLGATSNTKLFAVNGNLTLDGKLDITDAGGFSTNGTGATIITPGLAPVIYRLYTYTGSLINNGLDINTVPAGADPTRLFVQTAVNGQVNLIDTNGAVLNYWDGDDTSKYNDGSPDGGNGTWFGTSGLAGSSGNWTGVNGGPTTIKSAGSYAIFAGAAGTVAVNNTNGTPDAAGLYFQTTGYTIGTAPNVGTISLANGGSGSNLDAAADVTATINAALTSAENISKTGTGTVILAGTNTYTGSTTVGAGTLSVTGSIASTVVNINNAATLTVANGAAIADTAAVTSAGTGAFTLANSETIGSLAGTGTVNLGANTLTTGGTNASTTYAGVIGGLGGGLTKAGNGNFTLTGVNTYTGATSITGTLTIDDSGSLGGGAYAGAITNNGALVYSSTADQTLSGAISSTGSLTQDGPGKLTLSGANSYDGTTSVNAGVLNIQNSTALGTTAGGTSVASGAALQLQNNIAVGAEALTLNGTGVSNDGALRNISGDNSWAGPITLGSPVRINSDAGLLTLSGGIGGAGQNLTVGGAGNTTVSGVIATTTGTLTKDGAGTLTLTNANTYTGATAVNAGTLAVTGSIASTVVDIATGATLSVSNGAAINDLAAVTSAGTGAFVLNNSETIGSLDGTGTVNLGVNTLTTGGNDASTSYAGVIGGTGGLTKAGTGNFTLTGVNTYTGNTAITGTLTLGGSGSLGSGNYAGNITNDGSLVHSSSANQVLSGVLSGAGSLIQNGAGTLTLTGNSAASFTGATTVNGSTLAVNGSIASSAVTVNNGGTLTGTGTVGTTSINAGGTLDAGSIGNPGILNVNGNLGIDGTYRVDISGLAAGAGYDQTKVLGTVTLGGGATLVLNDPTFAVPGGNGLTIIDNDGTDAVSGTFSGLAAGAAINAGASNFKIFYDAGDGNDVVLVSTTMASPLYINNEWTTAATVDGDQELAGNQTSYVGVNAFDSLANALATYSTANSGADYAGDIFLNGGDYLSVDLAGGDAVTLKLVSDGGNAQPDVTIQNLTGDANDAIETQTHGTLGNADLTVEQGSFAGVISGGGDLTKTTAGTLTLSGTNTYTGATNVNGGTLNVTGSIASSSLLTVNTGGTLTGTGTVGVTNVASGGTLANNVGSTLTLGTTTLDPNATTSVGLGATSNTKLFAVNGNLTLDGKLDISDVGGFSTNGTGATLTTPGLPPVVYHLYTYTGSLTNNGLDINSLPPGTDPSRLIVQTAINGQVNLIDTNGAILSYWDGDDTGLYNNNQVNGGDGVWTGSSPNWTDPDGVATAPKSPNSYAYFAGDAGTVTVDDTTAGQPTAKGMYFDTNGYLLNGGSILLDNGGNGSLVDASSGVTASINSNLSGTENLNKSGDGTIVLGGTNTYIGDTTVTAGTLDVTGSIASDNVSIGAGATLAVSNGTAPGALKDTAAVNSTGGTFALNNSEVIGSLEGDGTVDLRNSSILTTGGNNASTTYAGTIGGSGGLTKEGTGTMSLTSANTYDGPTAVNAGVLNIQNGSALGSTTGGTTVASGAALQLQNDISVGNEALTLNGSGVNNDGALRNLSGANTWGGNVTLGSDSRINTDAGTLTIQGSISGSNSLTLDSAGDTVLNGTINLGGGALTKEGVGTLTLNNTATLGSLNNNAGNLVITPSGATTAGAFTQLAGATLTLDVSAPGIPLTVANSVSLAGTLSMQNISNLSGAVNKVLISVGDTATVSGTFDVAEGTELAVQGGFRYLFSYMMGDGNDIGIKAIPLLNPELNNAVQSLMRISQASAMEVMDDIEDRVSLHRRIGFFEDRASGTGNVAATLASSAELPAGLSHDQYDFAPDGLKHGTGYAVASYGQFNYDNGLEGNSERYKVGYDAVIRRDAWVGAEFSYGRMDWKMATASGDLDAYRLSVYGTWEFKPQWFLDGGMGAGLLDLTTERSGGLKGDLNGWDTYAFARLAWRAIDQQKNGAITRLEPFVGLRAVHTELDGFTESGGTLPYAVSSQSSNLGQVFAGVNWSQWFDAPQVFGKDAAWGYHARLQGFLGAADQTKGANMMMIGASGASPMSVDAPDADNWGGRLTIGTDYRFGDWTISADASVSETENTDSWQTRLNVSWWW